MTIWVVEDNYLQADWILKSVGEKFPDANIRKVSTESEFRRSMDDIAASVPALVVLDVILRWGPEPPPPDVANGDKYGAGIRCLNMLQTDRRTETVPVILYTVLEKDEAKGLPPELSDRVKYLRKESNASELIKAIRAFTQQG
jgi:hypothetical protein